MVSVLMEVPHMVRTRPRVGRVSPNLKEVAQPHPQWEDVWEECHSHTVKGLLV